MEREGGQRTQVRIELIFFLSVFSCFHSESLSYLSHSHSSTEYVRFNNLLP